MSRKCYLTSIAPSTEVDKASDGIPIDFKGRDPSKNESELGYKNFAIVLNFIESIEWLSLSSQGHKRISFNWINGKIISKWKIPSIKNLLIIELFNSNLHVLELFQYIYLFLHYLILYNNFLHSIAY